MDDPFVSCPYNPIHRVPRSRLQRHIVKCEWINPTMIACPYNATHRYTQEDMKFHVLNCPSKTSIFPIEKPPKTVASITTPKIILQKEYLPETDPNHEIWDD
ncbi:gametocyte-specific factor 1-like [Bombyx mandarina]|uniref:CHHC U11-48K-type domain-containing protein n=2 Tax=Bombyx TaxID=7090 RepID=A0A8R2HNQ0_BOMMO|nr:gametocyte-specific factor 1-like [Bombyx mori]XP_028040259.1 gametocyte-specific factor 1-like [Bombyx mandarina]